MTKIIKYDKIDHFHDEIHTIYAILHVKNMHFSCHFYVQNQPFWQQS